MVRTFGMNPKVGGSSSPQVETFLSQKLWHFHKNTRSYVENECCCPRTGYTYVNLILKNIYKVLCI